MLVKKQERDYNQKIRQVGIKNFKIGMIHW